MEFNIDKLNEIAKPMSQKAIDSAKFRKENRGWLTVSLKIAMKIRKILKDKNLKQTDLAESMGVSPQQVNKILSGKENLCIETIIKVAKALDLSFSQITDIERNRKFNHIALVENAIKVEPTQVSTLKFCKNKKSRKRDTFSSIYRKSEYISPNNFHIA